MTDNSVPVQMLPLNRDNLAEPFSVRDIPIGPINSPGLILPEFGGTRPSGVQFDKPFIPSGGCPGKKFLSPQYSE